MIAVPILNLKREFGTMPGFQDIAFSRRTNQFGVVFGQAELTVLKG